MVKIGFIFILLLTISNCQNLLCRACIQTVNSLQNTLIKIAPQSTAEQVVQSVCQKQYQSQQLCQKISKQLTPIALKVGVRALLKTGPICNTFCGSSFYQKLDIQKQIDAIISNKTQLFLQNISPLTYKKDKIPLKLKMQIRQGPSTYSRRISNVKLLYMSDVHLDFDYTVNASTVCDFPICCHPEHGFPQSEGNKAPQYGHRNCDTPLKLFESAVSFIKQNISQIDFIVTTGDYSAHNQWQKTQNIINKAIQTVQWQFQNQMNIKTISSPGNNQYLPDHQVDPLLHAQQAVKVTIVSRNGRQASFISVNTMFCDVTNLYLIQDQTLPLRQLKSLDKALEQSKIAYIFGHIAPTTSSCYQTYATLFRAIITKHSNKIKGQFYGHTHVDQFILNTNPKDNTTQTSFALLGGSLSPLGTSQPRFRVYQLTPQLQLVNYDDYLFDMNELKWNLNYNFKNYYNLSLQQPLNSKLFLELQQKIINNPQYKMKYTNKAKQNGGGSYYACETFDSSTKITQCGLKYGGVRSKINDLLKMLQGPWGTYGNQVQ